MTIRILFILACLFPHLLQGLDRLRELGFQPCEISGVVGGAQCGTIKVFENRQSQQGRQIDLNVVVVRSFAAEPLGDPMLVLQGGPGQAATTLAEFYSDIFGELRRQRDIVLVDQRGTGKSNSLQCDLSSAGSSLQLLPTDAIARCKKELEKKADIRLYTTTIAMQDLDEVRRRLGYKTINIYGTSYGTWAAFSYLRQYPDSVRTLILKGVVPPTMQLSVTTAFDSERAMDQLIADCASDASCANAFPKLREEYTALLNQLRKGPIEVKVAENKTVQFTREALMLTLRALLHAPGDSTQLPLMIHQAANGNLVPLVNLQSKLQEGYRTHLSIGMFLTIYCSEEMPRIDQNKLPKELDSTFHGDTWVGQFFRNCPGWPKGDIPADFHQPVRSDKPVLLISGGLDPVTPERWAAEAAKTLPNSLNVVAPKGGHSFNLMKGCIDRIITEFVQKGNGLGIDTSCAQSIKRPPFVVK